jgi:Zn-dependent metalloprotease
MKRCIHLIIAGIFLLGNTLTGQVGKKVYTPMPAPPRYLDSMLVSNGILEIAERVYDNGWIDFKQDLNIDPAAIFNRYQKYFGFAEGNVMVLDTIIKDDQSYVHYYYHQEYQGIPLDNLDYVIHAKNGKPVFGNGRFVPKLGLQQSAGKISRMIPEKASSAALTKFKTKAKISNSETVFARTPNSDPADEKAYRLAYKITAHDNDSNVFQSIKTIYVDASTNHIFKEMEHSHRSYYSVSRENGTVNTLYNGSQNFKLVSYKQLGIIGLFRRYYALKYIDPNKSSLDLSDYVVTVKGTPITGNGSDTHEETDNTWTSGQERLYASMLWAYEKSWDYLAACLNKRDIRNKIGISISERDQTAYDGAYSIMFGAGISGVVKAMIPLDIVAHEYTHIITQHYRGLKSEGETAALIESFSDIFGAIVQRSVEGHTPSRVYMMGEDIYMAGPDSNKFYLRSFATPKLYGSHPVDTWNSSYAVLGQPTTYGGEFWYFGMTDRGGEHTNNSIQNHWFYLLAEGGQGTNDLGISYNVTGIGFDKARIIFEDYYINNTTKSLTFYDARNATLQSAEKFYGLSSNEYQQVYNAWEAVGVGNNSPSIAGPAKIEESQVYTLNNFLNNYVTWLVTGDYTLSEQTNTSVKVTRTNLNTQTSGKLTAVIQNLTEISKEIASDPLIVTISGPSLVCSVGTAFTASHVPAGATWAVSSNLSVSSSSNSTASISSSASYFSPGSEGWISIKNSSGQQLVKKEVWVGIPAPEIQGPANPGSSSNYYAHNNYLSAATDYHWTMYAMSTDYCYTGNAYTLAPNGNMATATFNCNGDYQLYLGATNACGTSQGYPDILDIHVTGAGYYSYSASYSMSYPNPTSNILNIEIDAQAITRVKALEQTTTGGKQLKIDPAYDIRLYDGQGNLLRNAKTKGGTVQFNVANLANGIYYLHIYDGTGNKPEMRQIVVEH